jgi:hypothetical protein
MKEVPMQLRIRIVCFLIVLGSVGVGAAVGEKKGCSVEQGRQAETETDNLKTWESVYFFYQKYAPCDNGGVAEGVSDAVAKLLANHWNSIATFVTITDSDKNFEKFVLRHVDSTIDWEHDGPKIHENAQQHCPVNLKRLCKDLMARATPPREMGPK